MNIKKKQDVKSSGRADDGLDTLLDLRGQFHFDEPAGWWVKLDARRVKPSAAIPHGIRYSLTLHDPANVRVLGFDNAHGVPKSKNYVARRVEWDHKHEKDKVVEYEFENAGQLVTDFWSAVDRYLKSL